MDDHIEIHDLPLPVGGMPTDNKQQVAAVGIFPLRVAIGKQRPYVAHRHRTHDRVDDRVQHHIAVAVGEQAPRIRDLDTTQYKLPVVDKPVNVCPDPRSIFVIRLETHSVPLVLGISSDTIFTAWQSACPSALKIASAIWWLLVP